jgi:hypothetical protein
MTVMPTPRPDATRPARARHSLRTRSASSVLRAVTRVAALALIAGTAVVATAPEASAASCYDRGCDGRDPQSSGCSADAYTVASKNITFAGPTHLITWPVEIRFSSACQAQWTRLKVNHAPSCTVSGGECPGVSIYRWAQGSYPAVSYGTSVVGNPYSWTPMVGARTAQAQSVGCIGIVGVTQPYQLCANVTA